MSEPVDVHYFSNGTEGHIWMDGWCNRCVHDHVTHNADPDYENGCVHICSLVAHLFDPVFIPTEETITRDNGTTWQHHSWDCVEFSRCPCDRRDDPGVPLPPPVDPNQLRLFEVEGMPPGIIRYSDDELPVLVGAS